MKIFKEKALTRQLENLTHIRRQCSERITQEKILDLSRFVLLHPPYSSDLTLSDFHLYRSLKNALKDKKMSQEDQGETFGEIQLRSTPTDFYLKGIKKLAAKREDRKLWRIYY